MASPRQAVYRHGRWVGIRGQKVDQDLAWAAWRNSRRPGDLDDRPEEHSVVTLGYARGRDYKPPKPPPRRRSPAARPSGATEGATYIPGPRGRYTKVPPKAAAVMRDDPELLQRKAEEWSRSGNPLAQLFGDLVMAPVGAGYLLGAAGRDIGDVAHGDFDFERTRHLVSQMGRGTLAQLRDPLHNVGHLAPLAFGGLGLAEGALTRGSAFARAAAEEGARAGLTRSTARGGSLLHRPIPPSFEMTMGGATVRKPLSQNLLYRNVVQKPRLKATQKALDKGVSAPLVRPAATFGMISRAEKRILDAVRLAPNARLARLVRKASEAERSAVTIVATMGSKDPVRGARLMAQRHAEWADRWEKRLAKMEQRIAEGRGNRITRDNLYKVRQAVERNRELSRKFGQALPVLEKPSKQFLELVEEARKVSGLTTRTLAGKELVRDTERAQATLAQTYERGKPGVHASTLGELKQVTGKIRMLEGLAKAKHLEGREDIAKYTPQSALGKLYRRKQELEAKLRSGDIEEPEAPEGSFFYSLAKRYTEGPLKQPKGAYQANPSLYGVGEPAPSRSVGGIGQTRTGKAAIRGNVPSAPDVVSARFQGTMRLESADEEFTRLWQAGSETRKSTRQIPIREKPQIGAELKEWARKAEEAATHSPEQLDEVAQGFARWLQENLLPRDKDLLGVPKGEKVPGIRWIDPAAIKHTWERLGADSKALKVMDLINDPARILTLFVRPAYSLNIPGNLLMGVIEQGPKLIANIPKAFTLERKFGREIAAYVDALGGETHTMAYVVKQSLLARGPKALANGWNIVVDRWYRRTAIIHEAEKRGYTGERFPELFAKDENGQFINQQDMVEVGQVGRKSAVDFDSLTPAEREIVRRFIYFYPWLSRGSAWVGRMLVEHPNKSAVSLLLGQEGAREMKKRFGEYLPHWMLLSSIAPVGKDETVNLSSIWSPTTLVQSVDTLNQAVRAGIGLAHGDVDAASPALEAFGGLAGFDTGSKHSGIRGVVESLPQYGIYRRLTEEPEGIYPGRGLKAALLPGLLGQVVPRETSRESVRERGIEELPPRQRAIARTTDKYAKYRDALLMAGKKGGLVGATSTEIPGPLKKVVDLREKRYGEYARLGIKRDKAFQRRAFDADIDLLVRMKLMDALEGRRAKKWAPSATHDQLVRGRDYLTRKFFDPESLIEKAGRALRRRGIVVPETPS